jgi:glycine/D-amino acid oxidase-like deaminating enzyme
MNRRTALQLVSVPFATSLARRATAAKSDRIVIVGAGIIGASIGYHLAKRGAQVTILEQTRPGAGATQNSFAWLNASKRPRPYYELNLMGIMGWRRLGLEIGSDLQIQWGGAVTWSATDGSRQREQLRFFQKWSYPIHEIDAAEITRLLPGVTPGPVAFARFNEIEATVAPLDALGVILKKAQQYGAKVEYPCELTAIEMKGIQTSKGPMPADVLVLAAGTGTTKLARLAGVNVPLKESAGLLAHTAPMPRALNRIVLAPGANIKQNPDGRIVTGTDFEATKIDSPSDEEGHKLLINADRFLPGIGKAKLDKVTFGHRVLPTDGFPIVGFAPRRPNLYIAAMHSGMTMCPVIGEMAAMEILDGATADILDTFRPARFA